MRKTVTAIAFVLASILSMASLTYASPEQEKAFVDSYKKAFEGKDEATMKSFLYTKGADPMMVEFFSMMMTSDLGGTITNIELKDLTPEDVKKADEEQPSPSGGKVKLTLKPNKKLFIKYENKDANGSSSSSSESFVAELDGKLVIPVPGPVK